MMRTLTSFLAGTALLLTAGSIGCTPDIDDPFTTITTTLTTVSTTNAGDGDGDMSETGTTGMGDGDGAGDGDGTPGDGDGAPMCGGFGAACVADMDCCDGFTCGMDGTCGIDMGGDGDGAPVECTSGYDPNMCAPPAMAISVMGIEGGFCSCPCTVDADCPAGPAMTMGACVLTLNDPNVPEFCALLCPPLDPNDPNAVDACPAGSACQEVQMGLGICTWP